MPTQPWIDCTLDSFHLPGRGTTQRVWLTDRARGVRVGVVPADGGEIASFQVSIGGRWREILYRAMDYTSRPPDGWDGRAPLLWPAAGRVLTRQQIARWKQTGRPIRNGFYNLGGRRYQFPGHGFARTLPWTLDRISAGAGFAHCACSLESTPATRRIYPFDFRIEATTVLSDGRVILHYEIAAGSGNRRPMPFNIGNHISFKMPFTHRGKFEDCTIRTPARKLLEQNKLCLLSGRERPVDLSRPTPLSRTELLDTVLGGYRRDELWLELNDPYALRMHIHHGETPQGGRYLSAEKDNFFVFWGTPQYRYFCPEPWVGRPNALETRRDCILLPPGERFVWEARFTPELNA